MSSTSDTKYEQTMCSQAYKDSMKCIEKNYENKDGKIYEILPVA